MLVVTHCQTCGQAIGHLYQKYLELVQKYAADQKANIDPSAPQDPGAEARKKGPSPEFLARQDLITKHQMSGRRQCCLYALFVNYDVTDILT